MGLFEWIKEIEKIYDDLIDKTNQENLLEIQGKVNLEKVNLETLLKIKQDFVNDILQTLSNEINEEIHIFYEQIQTDLKNVDDAFQKKKEEMSKKIIEQLGLNF